MLMLLASIEVSRSMAVMPGAGLSAARADAPQKPARPTMMLASVATQVAQPRELRMTQTSACIAMPRGIHSGVIQVKSRSLTHFTVDYTTGGYGWQL